MLTDEIQKIDPIKLAREFWPGVTFYKEQKDIIYSVWEDEETIVPAANMMGKDFVSGFIVVAFFLTRTPCRIVTTSAKDDHLSVLWGEINRFINTCKYPLKVEDGGPLIVNHRMLKKVVNGVECPISYVKGMVSSQEAIASMQGHHATPDFDSPEDAEAFDWSIPRTLFVIDESSSAKDDYYTMAKTWCHRLLAIGNTWDCYNFFRRALEGDPKNNDKGGTRMSDDGTQCYRRVIHIPAERSPNVRFGLAEQKAGRTPSGKVVFPGVLTWKQYQSRLNTWDEWRICVSLNARFYKGAELLLYPPEWLNNANAIADTLGAQKALTMGVDPAEGGDSTCWTIIGRKGIIEQLSMKTPDTSVIPARTIEFMRRYGLKGHNVYFDAGGGGKEHADQLRRQGFKVKAVGFGESVKPSDRHERFIRSEDHKYDVEEERYAFKNRRAEMYWMMSNLLNPVNGGFGIPRHLEELQRQLSMIPKLYDEEGRLYLPPKRKKKESKNSDIQSLEEMLGCSPDEADSFALAAYGLEKRSSQIAASIA